MQISLLTTPILVRASFNQFVLDDLWWICPQSTVPFQNEEDSNLANESLGYSYAEQPNRTLKNTFTTAAGRNCLIP